MLDLTGLPVCYPVKFIVKYVSSAAFIKGNGMHTITLLLYWISSSFPPWCVLSSFAVYPETTQMEKKKKINMIVM